MHTTPTSVLGRRNSTVVCTGIRGTSYSPNRVAAYSFERCSVTKEPQTEEMTIRTLSRACGTYRYPLPVPCRAGARLGGIEYRSDVRNAYHKLRTYNDYGMSRKRRFDVEFCTGTACSSIGNCDVLEHLFASATLHTSIEICRHSYIPSLS